MGAGILTDQNQPIITPEARARLVRFLGILSRHRVAVFIVVILGIWFLGQLRNPGSGPSSSEQHQDQHDNQHEAEATAAVIASPVKGPATQPAKAAEQRDDDNDEQNGSK
jgi:hypothetical protein